MADRISFSLTSAMTRPDGNVSSTTGPSLFHRQASAGVNLRTRQPAILHCQVEPSTREMPKIPSPSSLMS